MHFSRIVREFLIYCMTVCLGFILISAYVFGPSRPTTRVFTSNRHHHSFRKSPTFNLTNLDVDDNLEELSQILENKLNAINVKRVYQNKPTCLPNITLANSCDKKCLQTQLPETPMQRIQQIVASSQLQMSSEEHQILREMASKVDGNYDIILLTAASSNHFLESQALLKNLHKKVYPYLKNFTLILYNLGLKEQEKHLMMKYCKCRVIDFPFDKFPKYMATLKCYAWKPVVIKAHLQKAKFVFWMDASIRFRSTTKMFFEFLKVAEERGLQVGGSSSDSTFRTARSMYHFFGDEPCAYLGLGQAQATLGVYHHEYFVDRVILEPWVACALNEECMCPSKFIDNGCYDSKQTGKKYYEGTGDLVYGLCHRYDQSALSLIIHKLYQQLHRWVQVKTDFLLSIRRRDTLHYFPNE